MTPTTASGEKSVLFVGINYAPEPTGVSPYTTGMAEGLARAGWDVRVITSFPHYPWWRVPSEYADLPERAVVRGVSVRRLHHYIPRRPGSAARRALFELSFGVRALLCRWDSPRVIVLVSPALLASRLVALRARLQRIPVVTWVQDIYAIGVQEAGGGTGAGAIGTVEASLLAASKRVVVIHGRFKEALQARLGVRSPIDVVRNWSHVPDIADDRRSETRLRRGWADDEIVVLHAGAMGAKQGLENVVRAAELARQQGSHVRFVLMGDGGQRATLEAMTGADAVTFLDPLPDDEFHLALAAADALLVNERPGLTDMSVPSKLTSYFAAGRPVIAAVGSSSTTRSEVLAAHAGPVIDADSPEELVETAESLSRDPEASARFGEAARNYRQRLLTGDAALTAFAATLEAATGVVRETSETSMPTFRGGQPVGRRSPS